MSQDFGQTLELIVRSVLTLVARVGRTFKDTLFRPRRLAEALSASEDAPSQYVGPYTFLVIAGFLGAKAITVTFTAHLLPLANLNTPDTLRDAPPVMESLTSLPSLQQVLLVGLPLVILIFAIGYLFRLCISRNPASAAFHGLFYTTGIQYLLVSAWAIAAHHLRDSESSGSEKMLDLLNGPLWFLLLVILPAFLLFHIVIHGLPRPMRRGGRLGLPIIGSAAFIAHFGTIVILFVGGMTYSLWNLTDPQRLAVLKVGFAGEPRIDGDSIEMGVILTNQTSRKIFLLSDSASITTSDRTNWTGRLLDYREGSGIVTVEAGSSAPLKFQGRRGVQVGLSEETRGAVHLKQVKANGETDEIVSHVWPSK